MSRTSAGITRSKPEAAQMQSLTYLPGVDLATVSAAGDSAGNVTGDATTFPALQLRTIYLLLSLTDVTNGAVSDTLDVKVQTNFLEDEASPIWVDVAAFTQIDLNATSTATQLIGLQAGAVAEVDVSAALAAGNVRQILGNRYRCIYNISDAAAADLTVSFRVVLIGKS